MFSGKAQIERVVQVRQIILIAPSIYAIVVVVAPPLAPLFTADILRELSLQDDLVEVELV